jgi:hypothetical protein
MVNALEDELTRPINIHRWRVLEVRGNLRFFCESISFLVNAL